MKTRLLSDDLGQLQQVPSSSDVSHTERALFQSIVTYHAGINSQNFQKPILFSGNLVLNEM